MATSDERSKLETFDGSNPGAYRMWKRRAQLHIAGLPNTVPKEKYGPRLMEFVKGEAESLLEAISVDELMKEGGDKQIWQVLDDKYQPQPRDLLQHALKNYFYDLSVRPSESYAQFLARYDAAHRLLKEQSVELPDKVRGYMLLKKLRLDPDQESMVLTHSQSNLEYDKIVSAVRGIFPDGKGPVKNSKEVFQMEGYVNESDEVTVLDEDEELQEAAEAIAAEHQVQGGDDDEAALETFESYLEVRKKLQMQRTNRGFGKGGKGGRSGKGNSDRWQLQGQSVGDWSC